MSKGRISNDHPNHNPTPNHLCQLLCWSSVRAGYAGGGDMSRTSIFIGFTIAALICSVTGFIEEPILGKIYWFGSGLFMHWLFNKVLSK